MVRDLQAWLWDEGECQYEVKWNNIKWGWWYANIDAHNVGQRIEPVNLFSTVPSQTFYTMDMRDLFQTRAGQACQTWPLQQCLGYLGWNILLSLELSHHSNYYDSYWRPGHWGDATPPIGLNATPWAPSQGEKSNRCAHSKKSVVAGQTGKNLPTT